LNAPEQRASTLDSGVRVVTEAMPAVRSAALGFFIGTGSSTEDEPVAGWSHLLEHMIFRGTARYESLEIDQIFDAMGAELNAGTGKDLTTLETRVLDEDLERAFDVLADMVWRPRVTAEDLASEREIVIEEIAMYEDDPQELVFDVLGGAVFGDHPLGRPIIGSRATVGAADADALRSFHADRYAPGDLVIAAAGSVDHDALVALVERAQAADEPCRRAPAFPAAPSRTAPTCRFIARTTEQYHLTLGGYGVARDDDRRFALRVLDMILGGTSSSRLFQAVRERRGLAYSVFSFTSQHVGTGQVGIYLGTRPDNVELAVKVVGEELERLVQDGVSADELRRARDHVRARLALDLESTESRMTRIGAATLSGLPLLTMEQLMERIDDVSAEDVDALARELFDPRVLSAAGIGPDEDLFRRGLETVAPELAQAA
jgi:predicted Zn-dependent peptidase